MGVLVEGEVLCHFCGQFWDVEEEDLARLGWCSCGVRHDLKRGRCGLLVKGRLCWTLDLIRSEEEEDGILFMHGTAAHNITPSAHGSYSPPQLVLLCCYDAVVPRPIISPPFLAYRRP